MLIFLCQPVAIPHMIVAWLMPTIDTDRSDNGNIVAQHDTVIRAMIILQIIV
jgi:hypothetical protein